MQPEDRSSDQPVRVTVEELLYEAIKGAVRAQFAEERLVTHYVVVAETVDDSADRSLAVLTSPAATPWMRTGMLAHAVEMVSTPDEEE